MTAQQSSRVLTIYLSSGILLLFLTLSFAQELTSPSLTEEIKIAYGIIVNPEGRNYVSHTGTKNMITEVRQTGFNFIIPQMREDGYVYYLSQIEPRSLKISLDYIDPLQDMLLLAHSTSLTPDPVIEVYPALEILPVHRSKVEPVPAATSLVKKRPEWLSLTYSNDMADSTGLYILDPTLPAVQLYLEELIKELVRKYDIKGIYLTDLYYPASTWGYNAEALKLYQQETGTQDKPLPDDSEWKNWRRKKLTQLLRRLVAAVKMEKPELKVVVEVEIKGPAPQTKDEFKSSLPYNEYLQDWVTWAEAGITNAICLKNHWREYAEAQHFTNWLKFLKSLNSKSEIWISLAGSVNFTDDIIEQLRRARMFAPQAIILDNYRQPTRDNRALLFSTLKRTAFSRKEFLVKRFVIETPTPLPAEISPKQEELLTSPTVSIVSDIHLTSPTTSRVEILQAPTTPSLTLISPLPMEQISSPTTAILLTPSPVPPTPVPTLTPLQISTPVQWDTIILKNGNIIRGKVIETINYLVSVETEDGLNLNLNEADIERIIQS
ncbi:MAG: family 10 glycosylhydrolase, partial [Candidatus Sumerlaeia bacterium]|nr:family 10 glycosylhydrolase [Candidatus Sumerlaeia bacterium]